MEIKEAVLVLADISGYTQFIKKHNMSVLHAEQIITDLLEAVIDTAEYPLQLNKLEGDAALLYTPAIGNTSDVTRDVVRQTLRFFEAFAARQERLLEDGQHVCTCDACTHMDELRLKAFLHVGEIVVKQVRQFEEIAGEPVILLHRLLKNSVPAREYVLMTEAFAQASGGISDLPGEKRVEQAEGIGPVPVVVYCPAREGQAQSQAQEPVRRVHWRGVLEGARLFSGGLVQRLLVRRHFENLPDS